MIKPFIFSYNKRRANELDIEIRELKYRLRQLECQKKHHLDEHYRFGISAIFLRRKLRNKKGR